MSMISDMSKCTSAEENQQEMHLNNDGHSLHEIPQSINLPNVSDTNGNRSESNEYELPLADSYSIEESQFDIKAMVETYFSFIPPESSSESVSKTISEQMSENSGESDPMLDAKSLSGESV